MEDAHADLAFCRGDNGRGRSVGESGVEPAAIETRTISDVRLWLFPEVNAIAGNVRFEAHSGSISGKPLTSGHDPELTLVALDLFSSGQ